MHRIKCDLNVEEGFKPYLSRSKINGEEITILLDTGTNTDVVPWNLINSDKAIREFRWVKQTMFNDKKCLPVAEVTVE